MKFILDNIFLIGIALISGGALLFPLLQNRGAKVSQLQATQYMNQGKTLVLDVRDAAEFAEGHLPNAKKIPLAELNNRLKEIEKSKNTVVITVCAKGMRSATATALLTKAGFAQVCSLEGGTEAWKTQGMPIIK